ncbi:MAG: tRNA pseudouridine(38-40) synthase TruA [Candidatus Marinimicrobia bacterium]|jgi:tRNA pseudouridine38-40 synthase|nr:tRNA pseudouridine(38-40) synthase TruA [Candidatus Neomarinimicrobiota bacterium]MCK9559118.1 tRNA pseudouridine(38-40) synthase TruA [Candidatus Neomarinimicrobiota bacterium]MDD5060821.1 tRNA pseudouridine(38-40) synthase TruA [Candidatus Neomarinimicrobiota bacterium]
MPRRFKIVLQYDGTNYCGWQRQLKDRSIQAEIEEALKPLNRNQPVAVIGAGRTDSGVHARRQTAHFDLITDLPALTVHKALNATLPDDIYVDECREVAADFHARFAATRRTYRYQIALQPAVFMRRYVWLVTFPFELELLQNCAALIVGEHDFTALCRASTEAENKVCTVIESSWGKNEGQLIYTITANRFLHGMVRMLVGSMMEIARGKYPIAAFKNLLGNNSPEMQVYTAPAQGLVLWNVKYLEEKK